MIYSFSLEISKNMGITQKILNVNIFAFASLYSEVCYLIFWLYAGSTEGLLIRHLTNTQNFFPSSEDFTLIVGTEKGKVKEFSMNKTFFMRLLFPI